ncbi:ATP-binding protein [bacterium]|nr:MAG: ATP-binding protein [bacterium]QQR62298.1 MAG: ATP-binding protein [bacterium]QQR63134.1 MAG: ATP-binding protein [bacterium]
MDRLYWLKKIADELSVHPACALLGPRQVGKTTLAKEYAKNVKTVHLFDLENPLDLARLENPMLAFGSLAVDLIIIDEIQLRPDLFPVLRVLVDQKTHRFLILGSASRDLLKQSSETLAGRIGYIELTPFWLTETKNHDQQWLRGGFPLSYLAARDEQSFRWRQAYIATFMERDIPSLGFAIPPALMRRLWMMIAHVHGSILNATDLGRGLDLTHHTVLKYIDILEGTFMVRVLRPWFENISKRQVKSPKLYIRDSGILHALLSISQPEALYVYPKLGASWEGFALETIINQYELQSHDCYFWSTQGGAELDLFTIKNGKRLGFEFKYTDSPKITRSMHVALQDLALDHLYIVWPHEQTFSLAENITVLGLKNLQPL